MVTMLANHDCSLFQRLQLLIDGVLDRVLHRICRWLIHPHHSPLTSSGEHFLFFDVLETFSEGVLFLKALFSETLQWALMPLQS